MQAKKLNEPRSGRNTNQNIVFHTQDNIKLIREDIENELFSYLGGILKNYKSNPLQNSETSGHIHILCTLLKTMAPADLVEEIKKSSSKWIKTKGVHYNSVYLSPATGLDIIVVVQTSGFTRR